MRAAKNWNDYRLLDTSGGERLELWGEVALVRPDPQVIWNTQKNHPLWKDCHAHYLRSSKGGGRWEYRRQLPEKWTVRYGELSFGITPTNFKHTGLFPEQAANWDLFSGFVRREAAQGRQPKVLNLFAYTGGLTLALAAAGAEVTHVDASKGMVAWARQNAALSGLEGKPIRWIVDDCEKFVAREIRRGKEYDAVIMDPPSYGRGPGGEIWKLEESLYGLVALCTQALSKQPLFFAVNSYTAGLNPGAMRYLLDATVGRRHPGRTSADEIGLPVEEGDFILPCGATALWVTRRYNRRAEEWLLRSPFFL